MWTSLALALAVAGVPGEVEDDVGRVIRLSRRPQRIVSTAPSNTAVLFALGDAVEHAGRAVRSGRVDRIDPGLLFQHSQRLVDGVELLVDLFHGDGAPAAEAAAVAAAKPAP